MKTKLIPLKKLIQKRAILKKEGKRVVFTNGCFDLIHAGHVRYLDEARKAGDLLIIGLNRDASVRRLKGKKRPLVAERDRAEVLSALECVDYVVFFGEDTPEKLIRALKPDVLVKGSDWAVGKIAGADFVKSYGGKIKRIRLVKGRSTTTLIEKILNTYK
jgi:rfaE bifunctional protein nucleotidyltransferase chain/domain